MIDIYIKRQKIIIRVLVAYSHSSTKDQIVFFPYNDIKIHTTMEVLTISHFIGIYMKAMQVTFCKHANKIMISLLSIYDMSKNFGTEQ